LHSFLKISEVSLLTGPRKKKGGELVRQFYKTMENIELDRDEQSSKHAFSHWNVLYALLILFLFSLNFIFTGADRMGEIYFMPFLGMCAASLANAVPVGGGIVFVPALTFFNIAGTFNAVSFTTATQTFGNGVFGFGNWLKKDPSVFIYRSFPFTVLPCWICTLALMLPNDGTTNDERTVKWVFACFSFCTCIFVFAAWYFGGVDKMMFISDSPDEALLEENEQPTIEDELFNRKDEDDFPPIGSIVATIFFGSLGGALVANIGLGNALVTFLSLSIFWKAPAQRAIVTAIITGGWSSALPFVINIGRENVPYDLWLMVLPGVCIGAFLAPFLHGLFGKNNILLLFATLLLLSSSQMFYKLLE